MHIFQEAILMTHDFFTLIELIAVLTAYCTAFCPILCWAISSSRPSLLTIPIAKTGKPRLN